MKTVYKYPLDVADCQQVALPKGAEILSAAAQRDEVCLYARVDPSAPTELRKVFIHGTGHTMIDPRARFVGTVSTHESRLWWHVFIEDHYDPDAV